MKNKMKKIKIKENEIMNLKRKGSANDKKIKELEKI